VHRLYVLSFPTRRSSDLAHPSALSTSLFDCSPNPGSTILVYRYQQNKCSKPAIDSWWSCTLFLVQEPRPATVQRTCGMESKISRSEEHTSELQSRENLVC